MPSNRKITIASRLSKLSLIGLITIAFNAIAEGSIQAQETRKTIRTIEWAVLCEKFPLNSHCQQDPPETIKISLADFGAKDEWIRIDKTGNLVRLLFTRQNSGGFISQAIDSAIDAASPYPIPFSLYPRSWADRQTTQITFQPDNCVIDSADCTISGTETLNLPENTNIRQGWFILEYLEGELIRAVAFRIPERAKSEIQPIVVEYNH